MKIGAIIGDYDAQNEGSVACQGDDSVVALLGALAAGLRGAAVEKGDLGADFAAKEKLVAAAAIRDRIRRECSEVWREFRAEKGE